MSHDLNTKRESGLPPYTTTPIDDIPVVRARLKNAFKTGRTRPVQFRKQQLLAFAYLIKDNIPRFLQALASDLGRSDTETFILEIGGTLTEAVNAYHNVAKWSKPERAPWSLNWFATKPTIRKEPKGVVLMIGPFNYPIWLLLRPLVLEFQWDHSLLACLSALNLVLTFEVVMYTGGPRVASIVLTAAAKTLSPVNNRVDHLRVQLGGKSPAVIDPGCNLNLNSPEIDVGQSCQRGADYALVPKGFVDQFVQACKDVLKDFYPEGAEASDSFCRIVSSSHFTRIKGLLDRTGGQIVYGGSTNEETKFIEPTLVTGVKGDDSLMGEEIFGPVLPIIEVDDVDEAIEFINARYSNRLIWVKSDHPLALYVFSSNSAFKSKVIENTQSGTVVINDTMIQAAAEGLPFGGIGPSGSGYISGKFSFDTFTHLRTTLDSPGFMDYVMSFRYPPYNEKKRKLFISFLFPSLPSRTAAGGNAAPKGWGAWLIASLFAGFSVVLIGRSRLGNGNA
ncbi:NAD-aldehyde dehydrogenase [Lactarius psammicola]|nr:NAD-aldehyde dehydrogenase [Lactarius psammicola]